MSQNTPQKSALVTGGARRIGRAICLKLAQMGYSVAIQYNKSASDARRLQAEIEDTGGQAKLFPCDLLQTDKTQDLIPNVQASLPSLELIVNNASLFEKDTLEGASLNGWSQHATIHSQTPFLLSQSFSRHCRTGQIINILDTHVLNNRTQHFTYLLSKKNLLALTQMAAVALAPHIRVNGIAPGLILPPEDAGDGYLDRLAQDIPLQRKGSVSHIEQSVAFLIENDFLTGQVIYNDGGEHLL